MSAPVYRMRNPTSCVLLRMCDGRLAQKVAVACAPAESRGRRQGSPAGGQLRARGARRAPQRRDRGEVAPQQPPAGHRLGRPHRARVGRARRPRRARARWAPWRSARPHQVGNTARIPFIACSQNWLHAAWQGFEPKSCMKHTISACMCRFIRHNDMLSCSSPGDLTCLI